VRTVVVLPTYDEAENIEEVLLRIRSAAPEVGVLVVDDGSPDGTAELAEKVAADLGDIDVLRRSKKSGLGSAYRAGFLHAMYQGAEVLVEMDADLSHDPHEIPRLVSAVEHGADLAIGSRYVPGGRIPEWSWHRRAVSRWGNRYAAFALGLGINDATSGYRCYRAEVMRHIDPEAVRADGYGFQIEMTYRVVQLGGRIVEIPISFVDRELGASKFNGRIVVEALGLVTAWGVRDLLTGKRRQRRVAQLQ
jgi:dolichol-phosphate mannosyltransferase